MRKSYAVDCCVTCFSHRSAELPCTPLRTVFSWSHFLAAPAPAWSKLPKLSAAVLHSQHQFCHGVAMAASSTIKAQQHDTTGAKNGIPWEVCKVLPCLDDHTRECGVPTRLKPLQERHYTISSITIWLKQLLQTTEDCNALQQKHASSGGIFLS